MKVNKNECIELFASILDIKDRDGLSTLLNLDRKLGNTGTFDETLNIEIPSDLIHIWNRIKNEKYYNLSELYKEISKELGKYDNIDGHPNPFVKTSTLVKRTMRAKMENIKAETSLKHGKRANRTEMSYTNDEEIEDIHDESFSPDDTITSLIEPTNETTTSVNSTQLDNKLQEILAGISNKLADSSLVLLKYFYRLPTRRAYPQYYSLITQPISFSLIRRKMLTKKYSNPYELKNDLCLLFENSIKYYTDGSPANIAAHELLDEVKEVDWSCVQLESTVRKRRRSNATEMLEISDDLELSLPEVESKRPRRTSTTVKVKQGSSKIEKSYKKVLKIKDSVDGHLVASAFVELPSREEYPEYYEIINKPIDLNNIYNKIQNGLYKTIKQYLSDVGLMLANARFFNRNSSQIYKDTYRIEEFYATYFGPRLRDIVDKMQKNIRRNQPSISKMNPLNSLIEYIFRLKNQSGIRYIKACQLTKSNKEFKQTLNAFEDIHECFMYAITVLQSNSHIADKDSLRYFNYLKFAQSIYEKYSLLVSTKTPEYLISTNNIISNMFNYLRNLENEFGHHYLDTIAQATADIQLVSDKDVHHRTVSLTEIEKTINNSEYSRVDCFLNDISFLSAEFNRKFAKPTEPYQHTRDLLLEIDKLAQKFIDSQSYIFHNTIGDVKQKICVESTLADSISMGYSPESLNAVTLVDIYNSHNMTTEPLQQLNNEFFESVRFRDTNYIGGNFVLVSNNDVQRIFLIRELFSLNSGRKACVANLVVNPEEISLCYNRKYAENELIITKEMYSFKVKQIVKKLNVMHIEHFLARQPSPDEPVYIFQCIYNSAELCLSPIRYQSWHNDTTLALLKTTPKLNRIKEIIADSPRKTIEGFNQFMFLHLFRSSQFNTCFTNNSGDLSQVFHNNLLIRKEHFVSLKSTQHRNPYRVLKISRTTNGFRLHCAVYISIDNLTDFPFHVFYEQEVVETDNITEIEVDEIDQLCDVLNEADFLARRSSMYTELQVFVCCHKLENGTLISTNYTCNDINTFPDEIMLLKEHKFKRKLSFGLSKIISTIQPMFTTQMELDGKPVAQSIEDVDDQNTTIEQEMCKSNHHPSSIRWSCGWDNCTSYFFKLSALLEHFESEHARHFPKAGSKRSYPCLWLNCDLYSNDDGYFNSYHDLKSHVIDIHCATSASEYTQILPPKQSNRKLTDDSEAKIVGNAINNCGVVMRDAYIESLNSIIELRDRKVKQLEHELETLKQISNEFEWKFDLNNITQTHYFNPNYLANSHLQPYITSDTNPHPWTSIQHSDAYKQIFIPEYNEAGQAWNFPTNQSYNSEVTQTPVSKN